MQTSDQSAQASPFRTLKSPLVRVACDLCGSGSYRVVMQKRAVIYDRVFDVVRCNGCGLVFVNPRLPDDEIGALYDEDYYYGRGFDRTTCYKGNDRRSPEDLAAEYRDVVDTLASAYGSLDGAKVLDVGCGTGGLVRTLRTAGAQAFGVDSSPAAMQACAENGTPTLPSLERMLEDGETFDIVVAMEVIEHALSPKAFLLETKKLVRPGGLLFLTTGNWNLVRHIRGTPYVMPEGHIYYFTPTTLAKYFSVTGLQTAGAFNRTWVAWRAGGSRLGGLGLPLTRFAASVFSAILPGYGPFPVARRPQSAVK